MADVFRVINTTTRQFIREEEVNILRNRKLLDMMRAKGRFTFNNSGDMMDWKVRYKRAPMRGFIGGGQTLTFSRKERHKTAQLEWRGYAAEDSIDIMEKEKNKGTEAIIKTFTQMSQNLMDDVDDQFGDEFYIDGATAANSERIHGIETIFAGATASAGNLVGTNVATYAGLSTVRGFFGGNWSPSASSWPTGTGDAHYDFWSPLVVDYTNTGWSAATKTWPNTCVEVLRFALIKATRNKSSKKSKTDLVILNDELYRQFLANEEAKERIFIQRGSKSGDEQRVGFGDRIFFDGAEVCYEYGVPANLGYGWNVDHVEFRSLLPTLFEPQGPDFDIASQMWRFAVVSLGNLRINPRYQFKLVGLS